MFLDVTIRRNPALIRTAIELHQAGEILPNTYLIDLDTMVENARAIVRSAKQHGLRLYGMTKQQGRNPLLAHMMVRAGIERAVAVDFDEAKTLSAYGIPIGNLGHLTQIPERAIPAALEMEPEVITVFSVEKAEQIGRTASQSGKIQPLLMRIAGDRADFYPAQEGGFTLQEVVAAAQEIARINGVDLAGVTTFPCLKYDYEQRQVVPTRNLATLTQAAEKIHQMLGDDLLRQINGPGVNTSATMEVLAGAGVTHIEPGSSLTGHTPLHAFSDEPERPAMVYVTEISHRLHERLFVYGGGFYPRGRMKAAVVARSPELAFARSPLPFNPLPPEAIDYYGELDGSGPNNCSVGDSAIFAFRSQVFVSRSSVAVVSGLNQGTPQLLGIFDRFGNALDPVDKMPLGADEALAAVESALHKVEQATVSKHAQQLEEKFREGNSGCR